MSQGFTHDYIPVNYRIAQNVTNSFNGAPLTETDLYIDSVPAGTFLHNGDQVRFHYAGSGSFNLNDFVNHHVALYVAGVKIFDTHNYIPFGFQSNQGPINWIMRGDVVRDTTSSLKCLSYYSFYGIDNDITGSTLRNSYFPLYFPITGVNFNATMSIRLTGTSETASYVTANFSKTLYNL